MKKTIAIIAIVLIGSPCFGANNAQDEVFSDSFVLSSQKDTFTTHFVNDNGETVSVKSWTLYMEGTDLHFTTRDKTVDRGDQVVPVDKTWGETNRSSKQMQLTGLADNSSGTAWIRARGE